MKSLLPVTYFPYDTTYDSVVVDVPTPCLECEKTLGYRYAVFCSSKCDESFNARYERIRRSGDPDGLRNQMAQAVFERVCPSTGAFSKGVERLRKLGIENRLKEVKR